MASSVDKTDYLGSVPATAISCPDNGDKVIAEYHRAAVAALLANDDAQQTNITSLGNTKVAKAGDTMTGLLTANAGITVASGQDLTLDGVSVQGVVGFSTLGRVWLAGRKQLWRGRVALSDASQNVDVSQGDRFTLPANPGAARTITLKSTGVVPQEGETLAFFWNPGTAGGSGLQYTFRREDATVVATFVGAQVADTGAVCAEFEYTSGGWRLGPNSGTPNEYTGPTPGPESWDSYGVIPGAGA